MLKAHKKETGKELGENSHVLYYQVLNFKQFMWSCFITVIWFPNRQDKFLHWYLALRCVLAILRGPIKSGVYTAHYSFGYDDPVIYMNENRWTIGKHYASAYYVVPRKLPIGRFFESNYIYDMPIQVVSLLLSVGSIRTYTPLWGCDTI